MKGFTYRDPMALRSSHGGNKPRGVARHGVGWRPRTEKLRYLGMEVAWRGWRGSLEGYDPSLTCHTKITDTFSTLSLDDHRDYPGH